MSEHTTFHPEGFDYRTMWYPRIGREPFFSHHKTLEQATLAFDLLASYDLFQTELGLRDDDTNDGYVERWCPTFREWDYVDEVEVEDPHYIIRWLGQTR